MDRCYSRIMTLPLEKMTAAATTGHSRMRTLRGPADTEIIQPRMDTDEHG